MNTNKNEEIHMESHELPHAAILEPVNGLLYNHQSSKHQGKRVLVKHSSSAGYRFEVKEEKESLNEALTTWRGYATGKIIPHASSSSHRTTPSWARTIPPGYLLTREKALSFSWAPIVRESDHSCANGAPLRFLWSSITLRIIFAEMEGPSLRGTKLHQVPTLLKAGTVYRFQSDILPEINKLGRTLFGRELAVAKKLKSMCVNEPMDHDVLEEIIKDKTGVSLHQYCTAENLQSCIDAALRVLEYGCCVPNVEELKVGSLGHICYEIMLMFIAENARFVLHHDTNARYVGKAYFDVSPISVVLCLAEHPCFDEIVERLANSDVEIEIVKEGDHDGSHKTVLAH